MKKLLTIEDLVKFCEQQNFSYFSSDEFGYQICVQIPARFAKEETQDDLLFYAKALICHTGSNINRSMLTEAAAKKAIKSLAYKPVLANFCEIDGVRDFTSHDFEMDDDGNCVYYEKQIGCFTTDPAYIEDDPDVEGRKNIFARLVIPRNYTDAVDIIERKGGTNCSVELAVNELSWDLNERILVLNDVDVMGLTLLGTDPETGQEVKPGMVGAHVSIEDFSRENNSIVFDKSELINEITRAVMDGIKSTGLDNNITVEESAEILQKGGTNVAMNDIEETKVDEKFSDAEIEDKKIDATEEEATDVTPDVVKDFDGEPEEETEEPVEPVVEEEGEKETVTATQEDEDAAGAVTTTINALTDESDEEAVSAARTAYDALTDLQKGLVESSVLSKLTDAESRIAAEKREAENLEVAETQDDKSKRRFAVNGMEFEVSLSEIQMAVNELVNNTYSEADNDYYSVEVYEGSKTVVMSGMFSGKSYKQSYKVRNNMYSLVGDRVSVKAVYVTADEEAELDRMRSRYSAISDKLAKYESEPEKMMILNSADYANIADQTDFAELKKQENHFDLTVDELRQKADAMLLQYAKSGKLNFAAVEQKEEKQEPKKDFFAFARIEPKNDFLDGLLRRK